jgi:uracil-DNA glycosylase
MTTSASLLAAFPHARTPAALDSLAAAYHRAKLREDILACTACPLHTVSTRRVPWTGRPSNIVMIGEAPGATEDQLGEPFVGQAGKLLNSVLIEVGLSRDQIVLMNVICCRPPNNDFNQAIKVGAVDACSKWFDRQLELSGAWMVVLLGAKALQHMFGPNAKKVSISKLRGKPWWQSGRLYMPTWHPAYALRTRSAIRDMVADLKLLTNVLESDAIPPLDAIPDSYLAGFKWGPEQTDLLSRQGWVKVWSVLLGEEVMVTTDSFERQLATDPELLPDDTVRYSLSELVAMKRELGDFEALRRCHLVKKELGGRVVM